MRQVNQLVELTSKQTRFLNDLWDVAQSATKKETAELFRPRLNEIIREPTSNGEYILRGFPDDTLKRLVDDILRVYQITHNQFTDKCRFVQIVFIRHVYHKVAYDHRISSLKNIGHYSGVKDHTTVRSSWLRATNLYSVRDPTFMRYFGKYLEEGDKFFTQWYSQLKVV